MNDDIHVGLILAFFAARISAGLPITGLWIWLGKKRKAGRATEQKAQHNSMPKNRPVVSRKVEELVEAE
ncbi:hypothetical protein SAMN04488028_101465 [Reichenbachiella agariperforans]|uniref:Uncharacterized protein n=1 Tax=Reichenbachiella agariperforans TaxID=156994 RepID=A0A1M6K7B2_REIAG|nr:hypothetical protein SAMN04488028_101465 [Reichenbachiella agariperforans]